MIAEESSHLQTKRTTFHSGGSLTRATQGFWGTRNTILYSRFGINTREQGILVSLQQRTFTINLGNNGVFLIGNNEEKVKLSRYQGNM